MRFQHLLVAASVLTATLVLAEEDSDESKAIKKVRQLGGEVHLEHNFNGPLTGVSFGSRSSITDAELRELRGFKGIRSLKIFSIKDCPNITDAGIKEVKGLKNLTRLNLVGTQITDTGVKELKVSLPKLEIIR